MTAPSVADEVKSVFLEGEAMEAALPKMFGNAAEPMAPDAPPVSQDEMVARMFTNAANAANPTSTLPQGMVNKHDQYWRFCVTEPNCTAEGHVKRRGYIVVGPSMKTHKPQDAMDRFAKTKHAQPLPHFGQYRNGGPIHANWSRQNPFGFLTELFKKPGGINVVPRAQLIELGLHRNLIVRNARPDLADFVEVLCPHNCPSPDGLGPQWFANEMDAAAHLMVSHRDAVAATAVGKSVFNAIQAANLGQSQGSPETASLIQALTQAMTVLAGLMPGAAIAAEATPSTEAHTLAAPPAPVSTAGGDVAPEGLSPRPSRRAAEANQSARAPAGE